MSHPLAAYKWSKRHAFVIQQCRALVVGDVLGALPPWERARLSEWTPPAYPSLRLVARLGGWARLWWFRCPGCGRCAEALYVPPDAQSDDWRCRLCHNLIYACQRWGPRHPMCRRLPHRRRRVMQREAARQERTAARRMSRQQQRGIPAPDPERVAAEERAIAAMLAYGREAEARDRAIRERLNAEAAATEAALRRLAAGPARRVAAGARRTLVRIERRRRPVAPPAAEAAPAPAIRLTTAELARLRYAVRA